jgi:hypothetical protein
VDLSGKIPPNVSLCSMSSLEGGGRQPGPAPHIYAFIDMIWLVLSCIQLRKLTFNHLQVECNRWCDGADFLFARHVAMRDDEHAHFNDQDLLLKPKSGTQGCLELERLHATVTIPEPTLTLRSLTMAFLQLGL